MFKIDLFVINTKDRLLSVIFIFMVIIALFSGCASSTSGRLQSSPEVTEVFKNNQILSDHQYYYSGFQRIPYAIIGIDTNYQLRTKNWKPIELNPTTMKQLAYRMTNVFSLNPRGAWILDNNGNRVGIWYSSQHQTKVLVEKNNRIVVVNPEPPDLRGIP